MDADDGGDGRLDDLLRAAGDPEAVLAAFDAAPGLIFLAEGPELVLAATNATAREEYGVCLGSAIEDALPEPAGPDLAEQAREVFRTGESFVSREWRFESDAVEDGRVFYLVVRMSRLDDPDGEPRGVVVQAADVTTAVRAKQASAARAADRERRDQAARETTVTLQDALLPDGLPITPGATLAARYLFAEESEKAGGDWFDAVALEDGRVVLVVGDVVGHGVRASVVMGELRTLFEERVREDGDLAAALQLLEARAARVPQARATTVCAGVLDTATGDLTYCTAGHPPPLVLSAAGEASFLPLTGAGPLGSALPLGLGHHRLEVGGAVLFYSDGLVERPGRSPVQNTLDLARVAEDVASRGPGRSGLPQDLCRETVAALTSGTGFDDDITVLAAQRVHPPQPLDMTVPAFPDTLRAVRQALGEWLAELRVGQLDEMALQHAVGELVSNSVEHAYEPGRSRHETVVTVRARLLAGGMIEIEVLDRGTWRAPGPARGRGRGLAMASGFSDELEVTHDEHGTRALLRQRPTLPVDLLTAGSDGATSHEPMQILHEEGVLAVSGALDQRASDELRRRLSHATRGGTIDVVVDLAQVTLLGSAGVQVLFDEMQPGRRDAGHAGLRLVAPPGCAAQHVLEMVHLPYAPAREDALR